MKHASFYTLLDDALTFALKTFLENKHKNQRMNYSESWYDLDSYDPNALALEAINFHKSLFGEPPGKIYLGVKDYEILICEQQKILIARSSDPIREIYNQKKKREDQRLELLAEAALEQQLKRIELFDKQEADAIVQSNTEETGQTDTVIYLYGIPVEVHDQNYGIYAK